MELDNLPPTGPKYWLEDHPEDWPKYAKPKCLQCGGSGKVSTSLNDYHPFSTGYKMCECMDKKRILDDGWEID